MADKGGAGSTLANLAARRRQVQKTREMMGMGERGVQPVQRPIPGSVPADRPGPTAPRAAPGAAPGAETRAVPDEARRQMVEQTREFLGGLQAGGRGVPTEARYQPQRPGTEPLIPRLQQYGAEGITPEMQFYRLAGRSPSPRELAIFQARIELERQIGRPPTRNELKQYISRPEGISPAYPRAFEA